MNIEEIKEKIDKSKENHRYNITSSREWFENLLDYITNLQQENKQLKSILTELEEWLNLEIAIHDEDDTIDTLYSCVLDKIQELKEKYK